MRITELDIFAPHTAYIRTAPGVYFKADWRQSEKLTGDDAASFVKIEPLSPEVVKSMGLDAKLNDKSATRYRNRELARGGPIGASGPFADREITLVDLTDEPSKRFGAPQLPAGVIAKLYKHIEKAEKTSEAKEQKPIKARDPNWRDMEALRRSGASGSHGDKTKIIPRKEKHKNIPMEDKDTEDFVTMNVPLLIRVLEYAREDAETDIDLHNIIEKAVELGQGEPLTMKDYDRLVQKDLPDTQAEAKDPCWKGYKQIGMKKKGGKQVPNCVPERKTIFSELESLNEIASAGATSAGSIATVVNPHVAIGDKNARKRYGQKGENPNPPKAKPQKPSDNALDMKGVSVFGGTISR
jgi:hypothetical protein